MIILVDFNIKYNRFRPWQRYDSYRNYIKVTDEISGNEFLLWYKDGVKLYNLIPKKSYHLQRIGGHQFIEVEERAHHYPYKERDVKEICYKKMVSKKRFNELKLEYPECFI